MDRLESLGIKNFTIDQDRFRIVQAIEKIFQWNWKDKLLNSYSDEEIQKANLRTICKDEVILDCDSKEIAEKIKKQLDEEHFSYAEYETGSRGIHFSLWSPKLAEFDEKTRNYIRKQIIQHFGADITKAAEKTLISIVERPHWKTGNPKKYISGKLEPNNLPSWVSTVLPIEQIDNAQTETPQVIHEPCPALKRILDEGVGEGSRNNMRTNIVLYYYKERGLPKKEVVEKVREWNSKCRPPEDEKQVDITAINTMNHAEYNIGCQSWKDYCPMESDKSKCAWIKKYHGWLDDAIYEGIPVAISQTENEFINPLPEDHFISQYINYCKERTDAYPEYHLGAALALLSFLTNRKVFISVTPDIFYPNLWFMLIGDSTISRKSTSIKFAKNFIYNLGMADRLLPDDFTPEALVTSLVALGQRFFVQDEFEEFYASLGKDYKSGMAATMCSFFESKSSYLRQLRRESFLIQNIYLPILTSTTIETFAANKSTLSHIRNGLFARFNFLYPKREKIMMPRKAIPAENLAKEKKLNEWIKEIDSFFARIDINQPEAVMPTAEALEIHSNWLMEKEEWLQKHPEKNEMKRFVGRLQTDIIKIAFLIRLGRSQYQTVLANTERNAVINKGNSLMEEESNENKENKDIIRLSRLTGLTGLTSLTSLTTEGNNEGNNEGNSNEGISLPNEGNPVIPGNYANLANLGFASPELLTIDGDDMRLAIILAERYLMPYSERFIYEVLSIAGINSIERIFDVIVKLNNGDHDGVEWSDAMRNAHMLKRDFTECVNTLIDMRRIRMKEEQSKRGGWPKRLLIPLDPDYKEKGAG
jgi:hypothetical protein